MNFSEKMQHLITAVVVLFNSIYHIAGISTESYKVLIGLRITNTCKSITLTRDTILRCAFYCFDENLCKSANYNNSTKLCELNLKSPLEESAVVIEDNDWKIIYMEDATWQLIFRGTAGVGVKVYPAYLGTIQLSPAGPGCHLTHDLTCTTHYRSSIIDNWQISDIEKVRFTMYKDGKLVVDLIFQNLNGDSNIEWFNRDRLLNSSFTDMIYPQQYYNYFGAKGDEIADRRFYINRNYDGCPSDQGWMAVFDGAPICDYERGHPLPHFSYMPNKTLGLWENRDFHSADVLAIFVQKG